MLNSHTFLFHLTFYGQVNKDRFEEVQNKEQQASIWI